MLRTCAPFALLLVTALAGAAPARFGHFALDVPARGFEEHCLKLESGERIRYRFRATGDVDFNIHYHRGNDVTYPVKANQQRDGKGRFTATAAEDYCWMWTARGPAKVTGKLGPEE